MTRIAFLGTPEAAVPSLQALLEGNDLGLVVTQPDRPRGRSGKPQAPAVKDAAVEAGLAVSQPATPSELAETLSKGGPFDVAVVVAYGRILRTEVLEIPERGMLNVHFSLLPRWRGAAPVNRAIMAGDTMSGVTIIKLDEGLDTGPVLTAQAVDIKSDETAGALTERLADLGGRLVSGSIEPYLAGELVPQPQSDEGLTYASKLTSRDRPIRPDGGVEEIVNQVRGLSPTPGTTLRIDGVVHKILEVLPSTEAVPLGKWAAFNGIPAFGVADGSILIKRIQAPGKLAMNSDDWLRGRIEHVGSVG